MVAQEIYLAEINCLTLVDSFAAGLTGTAFI